MVPTLKISRDALSSNGFINGYIKDIRKDVQYENCIYLLFKPRDLTLFSAFLDTEYERTKAIIDDYDYEDGYVVVVYQLDMSYKKDFELVKQGKYSQTSKSFQILFPKIVKVKSNGQHKDEVSLQYRVFNQTEDLVQFWENKLGVKLEDDQELWHFFDEENEVLNLDKIKHYV
jgi:hypothetical protein